jgi:hypothetical protein
MHLLPPELQVSIMSHFGAGQGDSSGEENNSGDESDSNSRYVNSLNKIQQSRNKVRFLQPLQQQCLDYIIKNHETMAKTQKKQFAKIGEY